MSVTPVLFAPLEGTSELDWPEGPVDIDVPILAANCMVIPAAPLLRALEAEAMEGTTVFDHQEQRSLAARASGGS